MKRITQSLFEEIQKITSEEQLDEKKMTHDEDGDGDEDAADYMMKRRKAGGQSHAQAHAATRKHNEETEEEEELEQIDEIGDTAKGKKMLGNYIKKRTKQLPGIETNYQMTPYDDGPMGSKAIGKYKKKVNKGIGRAVDRLTKEEAELEEAGKMWPGTPEYNKAFPKDSKPGQRMSKQDYGYRGPSGSETEDKPSSEEGKTRGKGRRKVREETIIKHEDFTIEVIDNPTFKDFFNAAKAYVDNNEDAITVAEAFFKENDNSILIESEILQLFKDTLDKHENDGYVIEDTKVTIEEGEATLQYTLVEKENSNRTNYIYHGYVVAEEKGEQ